MTLFKELCNLAEAIHIGTTAYHPSSLEEKVVDNYIRTNVPKCEIPYNSVNPFIGQDG